MHLFSVIGKHYCVLLPQKLWLNNVNLLYGPSFFLFLLFKLRPLNDSKCNNIIAVWIYMYYIPNIYFPCYLIKMYSIHVVKKHVLQLFKKTIKLILLLKAKFEKLFFVDYNFKALLNSLYDDQFKPVLENSFSCCY